MDPSDIEIATFHAEYLVETSIPLIHKRKREAATDCKNKKAKNEATKSQSSKRKKEAAKNFTLIDQSNEISGKRKRTQRKI